MANPRYHWHAWQKRSRRAYTHEYHEENRSKVTLRDYRAHKWCLAQGANLWHLSGWDEQLAYFMSSPLDMERLQSREQCRLNPKQLASKAAKFLTLAAEYAHRRAWDKARNRPIPQTEPFGGRSGYGDTKAAKSYHARRVAEYRALQAEQFRQAA